MNDNQGIVSDPENGRYDIIPAECDCQFWNCYCGEVDSEVDSDRES
jgi:hypothetical protein